MDKFVPKEEGYYWFRNGRGKWSIQKLVWRSFIDCPPFLGVSGTNRAQHFSRFQNRHNGTFHEGPIQPPEEGRV